MFGFFEIGLPASIQTKLSIKSNKASNKGGLIGVAIMGFLSALIVGPCVAPPLAGALIYIGQSGDAVLGGSALFLMSIGMGVPLFIVGLGAGKLMPRAGSWMININKIFGVIMLGVAIWMISRIIPQNITNILWAILFIGSGLYLNPFEKIQNYKDTIFKTSAFVSIIIGSSLIFKNINPTPSNIPSHHTTMWKNISNISQFNEAIKNKNVIIDFTAKWCVACKEYEESTFVNQDVLNTLKNYSLYKVDVTNNNDNDKEIMKKFSIVGPPAILIFEKGKLTKKIIGYKTPKEFLKLLK
jgi:thiol:disulfide interchange protein DsbD